MFNLMSFQSLYNLMRVTEMQEIYDSVIPRSSESLWRLPKHTNNRATIRRLAKTIVGIGSALAGSRLSQ
jgi:hypothetical protein